MAGISADARRERKAAEALDKIRDRLPEVAEQLLEAGMGGKKQVGCPKCKHRFEINLAADPKILLSLWERVEGKPQETRPQSEIQPLVDLFRELRALRDDPAPRVEVKELPSGNSTSTG